MYILNDDNKVFKIRKTTKPAIHRSPNLRENNCWFLFKEVTDKNNIALKIFSPSEASKLCFLELKDVWYKVEKRSISSLNNRTFEIKFDRRLPNTGVIYG